eukprot:GHVU01054532.1.p1 GENE.GHVU01054532.1~~GHVU01054532.1.p1  ORF type:complete len:113 (+),score=12.81 GHVU01054532.1:112-450(+)
MDGWMREEGAGRVGSPSPTQRYHESNKDPIIVGCRCTREWGSLIYFGATSPTYVEGSLEFAAVTAALRARRRAFCSMSSALTRTLHAWHSGTQTDRQGDRETQRNGGGGGDG